MTRSTTYKTCGSTIGTRTFLSRINIKEPTSIQDYRIYRCAVTHERFLRFSARVSHRLGVRHMVLARPHPDRRKFCLNIETLPKYDFFIRVSEELLELLNEAERIKDRLVAIKKEATDKYLLRVNKRPQGVSHVGAIPLIDGDLIKSRIPVFNYIAQHVADKNNVIWVTNYLRALDLPILNRADNPNASYVQYCSAMPLPTIARFIFLDIQRGKFIPIGANGVVGSPIYTTKVSWSEIIQSCESDNIPG